MDPNATRDTVATAEAGPNIALVKYWGKRDPDLNLPAVGSISVTLDVLRTRTRVSFDAAAGHDVLVLNGAPAADALPRISACLDLLRARAGIEARARITTDNNFPTAAGLASSASAFAALVVAADAALGLGLDRTGLSELARRGSGSAARSIFGGFVEMALGQRADGRDAVARPLLDHNAWPLEVVIAVTSSRPKTTSSTDGMTHTAATSPFYSDWVRTSPPDLASARTAIAAGDFAALAAVTEHSCLKMHGLMLSANPGLLYWNPATVACMQRVRELRGDGLETCFTVDAGPQVKALCTPAAAPDVAEAFGRIRGVESVLRCPLGPGARIVDHA